ncbi:MAG: hypothetical protein GWN62_20585, partial [Aliifodinibius sp.]|nr:hypothetical protein [Fodinibius sp.]
MSKLIILSCLLFFLIGTSCQDSTGSTPGPADVQKGDDDQGNERVFIVDQTGKRWDVTHAEE